MNRALRVAVEKTAKKTRQPKSVSFNLTSAYEIGLLNHAEDPNHGDFSKYVKRLIHDDMRGGQRVEVPIAEIASLSKQVDNSTDEDTDTMSGFL